MAEKAAKKKEKEDKKKEKENSKKKQQKKNKKQKVDKKKGTNLPSKSETKEIMAKAAHDITGSTSSSSIAVPLSISASTSSSSSSYSSSSALVVRESPAHPTAATDTVHVLSSGWPEKVEGDIQMHDDLYVCADPLIVALNKGNGKKSDYTKIVTRKYQESLEEDSTLPSLPVTGIQSQPKSRVIRTKLMQAASLSCMYLPNMIRVVAPEIEVSQCGRRVSRLQESLLSLTLF